MDFHLPNQLFSLETTITTTIALLILYLLLKWKKNTNPNTKPPQPSGSWPLIGHQHLLGKLPHINLGKLADNYGPIFMIKLGNHQALVISNPEMAKECLSTSVFLDRPNTIFVENNNSAMLGFSPYGPYWRQMRKITTVELLSNHRLEMLKDVRISEIRSAIKAISEASKSKLSVDLDMKQWFNDVNLNTAVKLIAGKSLREFYKGEEYNRCQKAIRVFFELAGAFVPGDYLPFLRWFDIGGYEKSMKKAAKDIDDIAQDWLDEHKRRRREVVCGNKQDFMEVMLGIFENGDDNPSKFDADTVIKATCMAMILAASDTTAVTLTWALSLLLNNRDTLKKVQFELDAIVGTQRQVNESDLKNLVYLQSILKETLRLYPAGPLSAPREAITDCTVSGYHIPARTRLFVNLYKIHRDPKMWSDPLEFKPERFLTTPYKDYDVRGQNFEFIPFGSGRRICPGISFALQIMQFTLANLLHGFEISTPLNERVDMSEGFGLTNLKASPLEVVLIPRLPSNLYDDQLL